MEIWKDIPEYNGIYQVSSIGRVRTIKRTFIRSNGSPFTQKEKIKNVFIGRDGYIRVSLSKESKTYTKLVHQLIAMAFLNHKPNGHNLVVDHIDYNKLNNQIDNLQLITNRENCTKDMFRHNYTSDEIGVTLHKNSGKWHARIRKSKGKGIYLGSFDCEKEASKYYKMALDSINNATKIKIKKANFKSKYKGVYFDTYKGKKYFIAKYWKDKKTYHIGSFKTELEAHKARLSFMESILSTQSQIKI